MAALLLAGVLAGCGTAPQKPAEAPVAAAEPAEERRARESLKEWVAVGRVAVLHDEESWHANLHWEQRGERYHIRLIAPLGQGSVALRGLPGSVMMEHEEGAVMAASPEVLLERHIGWRIPVTGLHYWVRGLADPTAENALEHGDDGRPVRLDQNGWRIDFRRWGEVGGIALPEKVFMEADGLKVRLVIDQWDLPAQ